MSSVSRSVERATCIDPLPPRPASSAAASRAGSSTTWRTRRSASASSRYFFPRLVKFVLGEGDGPMMSLDALAAALIFVAAPVLGALSDQASRRLPFLVVSTLLCVAATFFLGQPDRGLMFAPLRDRERLLPGGADLLRLAPAGGEHRREPRPDRWAGRGRRLRGLADRLRRRDRRPAGQPEQPTLDDYANVFRALALVFLLFAIPAFLFVRERPRAAPPISWRMVPEAFHQLGATARTARRYRGLGGSSSAGSSTRMPPTR